MRKTTYYLLWAGAGIFGAFVAYTSTQPKAPASSYLCRFHVTRIEVAQAAEALMMGQRLRGKLDMYNRVYCVDVTLVYPDGKTELWRDIRLDLEPLRGVYR